MEDLGVVFHRTQVAAAFALVRQGCIFDHGHRHVRGHAARQQLLADLAQFGHTHIHHQRGAALRQRLPVHPAVILGVRRYQRHTPGHATQGQGDSALRGACQPGSDAVDQLNLNPLFAQPLRLFAATAEDARVAALEPHHAFAVTGIAQHQAMNKRLRGRAATTALAHRNHPCSGAMFQHCVIDQIVNQHHIRFAQGADGLERQQFRVTRACTYQPDFCTHRVFLTR